MIMPSHTKRRCGSKSEEARERAREILEKLKSADLTPDQRRLQAIVCVLELIASTDARRLLEDVAGAWLAGEAAEALKRI